MKNHIKALTLASYISMFFLGVGSTLVGASARNIGLSPFEIGLFLAFQNIGFILAVVISGALADTLEKPRILMVGSFILAFSFFTFYWGGIFWLNLVIMILIGVGIGTYEGVTDAMLIDMHPERQSFHININHFFVTFGAILITVYLIFLQMNWRESLVQSSIVVLILALFYAVLRLKNARSSAGKYIERFLIVSRERSIGFMFAAAVLIVGVEAGTIGILTTYLMDLRGFDQTTSKIGLVVFLTGIAVGRVIVGILVKEERITQILLILLGLATAFFGFLFFINLDQWTYLSVFFAGLALSALFPLIISLTGMLYPQMAGTVIGSIKVAVPLGGILLPFLFSWLSKTVSFEIALLVFPAAMLLAFLLLLVEFRRISAGEQASN